MFIPMCMMIIFIIAAIVTALFGDSIYRGFFKVIDFYTKERPKKEKKVKVKKEKKNSEVKEDKIEDTNKN